MNDKPFIVSISSISGGGKTTITKELCKKLNNSKALYFDEYEFLKEPEDICKWVEGGSNPNEWDLSLLVKDIRKIKEDEGLDYLILDYPFAKKDYPLKDFINKAIFIETPLDIALARRLIRDYSCSSSREIVDDLTFYLERSRICFEDYKETAKDSDLIIDGSLKISEIIEIIMENIKN